MPIAPLPMPRTFRPGGYAPGYTGNPFAGGGLVGNALGLNGNPIYDGIKSRRNMLMGLSAGLLAGDPSQAMMYGMQGRQMDDAWAQSQLEQQRRQQEIDKAAYEQRRYAEMIGQMGEAYAPLAEAVSVGAVSPADAYNQAMRYRMEDSQRQQEAERARQNAAFIKDPDLRQMVEVGALSFKDAYDAERGATSSGELGTTIYLGRDQNGQPVPMQVGQQGFVPSALPPGVTFDPGGMAGARTESTADAKTVAAARAALPGAEQTVGVTLDSINALRGNSQGQAEQFGALFGIIPNRALGAFPGTAMGNFQADLAQASGQAFLQARQMLKGGGQITDFEGRRAEAAISRLQVAAEKGDQDAFNDALDDFEAAVVEGYRKLVAVAGGQYSAGGPAVPAPAAGAVDDYKARYGLQ